MLQPKFDISTEPDPSRMHRRSGQPSSMISSDTVLLVGSHRVEMDIGEKMGAGEEKLGTGWVGGWVGG